MGREQRARRQAPPGAATGAPHGDAPMAPSLGAPAEHAVLAEGALEEGEVFDEPLVDERSEAVSPQPEEASDAEVRRSAPFERPRTLLPQAEDPRETSPARGAVAPEQHEPDPATLAGALPPPASTVPRVADPETPSPPSPLTVAPVVAERSAAPEPVSCQGQVPWGVLCRVEGPGSVSGHGVRLDGRPAHYWEAGSHGYFSQASIDKLPRLLIPVPRPPGSR